MFEGFQLIFLLLKPYTGKHCKAKKESKTICKRMISTAQNRSNIHPRLNFMHFIISNTKKVLLFLSCVLPYLETGWHVCVCLCVCACGVKTAIDRVKGFSSGCFWRRPRWRGTTPHEWWAGSSDAGWAAWGRQLHPDRGRSTPPSSWPRGSWLGSWTEKTAFSYHMASESFILD